jgi:hypothetical protein
MAALAWAQTPHGTIRGKITDQQGFALPGASIYLRSEHIMGMKTFITSDTGIFQFQALLPGKYQLTLEMPGFKTAKIDDIVIHSGQTVKLMVQLEMTTIEEEIILNIPIPVLDEEAFKTSTLFDREMLSHIPFRRNLREVITSAAGVFSNSVDASPAVVLTGASERDGLYHIDSLVLPDPLANDTAPKTYYDIAHEIQIATSDASAEVMSSDAGYINIVTRPGGPAFQGELFLQHSNESLIADLNTPKELEDQNVTKPASSTSLWDMSLAMSGPIYGDLLRFYSQVHYVTDNQTSTFSPWTDPQGTSHSDYEGRYSDVSGLFRLTGKFIKEMKFTGIVSYSHRTYPTYTAMNAVRIPEESTSRVDPETNLLLTGWLDYALNRQTFVDLKAGYIVNDSKVLLNSEGAFKSQYVDAATGYMWGSGPANNWSKLKRFMGSATLVHFNDRILGGNQKFMLGLDYESTSNEWNTWKNDNLIVQYLDGSPYYFGEDISPATGGLVGTGRIAFSLLGKEENSLFTGAEITRLGFFAQDTITLGGRVSLNLGLRFDRTTASLLNSIKAISANSMSYQLGKLLIQPVAYINPYSASQFPSWDDVISWNFFSPRVGMVIDILGNGRTLLKASFARSPEALRMKSIAQLNAYYLGRQHEFFWFDENQDQEVNTGDSFLPFPEDYRLYNPDYYKRVIAGDLKSPYTDEFMVGIENQFFDDLTVRLSYIYKQKENIIEDVLYNPDTDQEWYSKTTDTEGWWIPFTTEIPAGVSDYDSSPLTLYYRSRSAPPLFYRLTNVPELKRNYKGLELVIRKRMSHNWQFSGSLVYSRTTGNLGLSSQYADPFSHAANSPNYFVNLPSDSVLDYDIPLTVNMMGTYCFPYEFYLSFYYTYRRGRPWARSVIVVPPEQWALDNNVYALPTGILSESFGSRRYESTSNLNLRLEKDIQTGWGRLNAAVDVFNALGSRYHWFDLNDGGFWSPADEKTAEGVRILSPVYGQGINLKGVREFRFSLRLFF